MKTTIIYLTLNSFSPAIIGISRRFLSLPEPLDTHETPHTFASVSTYDSGTRTVWKNAHRKYDLPGYGSPILWNSGPINLLQANLVGKRQRQVVF